MDSTDQTDGTDLNGSGMIGIIRKTWKGRHPVIPGSGPPKAVCCGITGIQRSPEGASHS